MIGQLDHVGFVVRDLDEVADAAVANGFRLTEKVPLMNGDDWAGGWQQMVELTHGYLEFQQLEPGHGHPLEARAAAAPTLAVVAWRVDRLETALTDLRGQGCTLTPPAEWSRPTPNGLARFRFSVLTDADLDTGAGPVHIVVEHLTPALTIDSGSTQPNGIDGLAKVIGKDQVVLTLSPPAARAGSGAPPAGLDSTGRKLLETLWGCQIEVIA